MADRYPLIYNPSANQIQELQSGDSLDAGNASIKNVTGLTVSGVVTATSFDGTLIGTVGSASTASFATTSFGLSGTPDIAAGNVQAGIVTATTGFNIGIQSGGTNITTGVITAINFVGSGNSISYNSSTKTVDVSISGSSGAAVGSGVSATGINTGGFWSNPNSVDAAISLTNPNHNYGMFGPVALNATVTVGAGNTFTVV